MENWKRDADASKAIENATSAKEGQVNVKTVWRSLKRGTSAFVAYSLHAFFCSSPEFERTEHLWAWTVSLYAAASAIFFLHAKHGLALANARRRITAKSTVLMLSEVQEIEDCICQDDIRLVYKFGCSTSRAMRTQGDKLLIAKGDGPFTSHGHYYYQHIERILQRQVLPIEGVSWQQYLQYVHSVRVWKRRKRKALCCLGLNRSDRFRLTIPCKHTVAHHLWVLRSSRSSRSQYPPHRENDTTATHNLRSKKRASAVMKRQCLQNHAASLQNCRVQNNSCRCRVKAGLQLADGRTFGRNAECTHSRFTSDSHPFPNRFSVWCSRFAVGYVCTPWIFVLTTSDTVPDCPVASVEKLQHVGIFGPTEGQSAGSCTNMHMKATDWRGGGCAWPVWYDRSVRIFLNRTCVLSQPTTI